MSLPLAFFAKTSRLFEITKVQCFIGFPSTGRVWGSSRGFEPLAPIRAFLGGDECQTRPVVCVTEKLNELQNP
jgi:hypothetical protein